MLRHAVECGIARQHAARCRTVAALVLLLVGLAGCGSARSTPPRSTSGGAAAVKGAIDPRDAYAALRRPATRADLRGARYVRTQLGERFRPRASSVRRVATAPAFADRIYVASGEAAICVVSSARLEIGCDELRAGLAAVSVHTIICSPYLPGGIGELYGMVPDVARDVRVELRDGRVVRPIVHANVFRYYWVKYRRPVPKTIRWRAHGRPQLAVVPLPDGHGWLDC